MLVKRLKDYPVDVRVIILGHLQRGGTPSALIAFWPAVWGEGYDLRWKERAAGWLSAATVA